MNAEVVRLPRPRDARPQEGGLGFFVRVGRNDHREILDLIATGERGIFGFVIEAQHVNVSPISSPRHKNRATI